MKRKGCIVYDIESYPNFFSFAAVDLHSDAKITFEISDRVNQIESLLAYLSWLKDNQVDMIGFNNIHYDYPMLHAIMLAGTTATYASINERSNAIIKSRDQFEFTIWPNQRFIPQIDLLKIHHFDNVNRRTNLKALQVNMRSESVEDLPFPPGTILTDEQKDVVLEYNIHDIDETKRFAELTIPMIDFRRYLSEKYDRDFMNHNDTKIGKDYFIMQLGDDVCYHKVDGKRKPRQTYRDEIDIGQVVFPYLSFDQPEFTRILEWFKSQKITETNGVFKDVSCTINGFTFDFGTGGIHGSIKNRIVRSTNTHVIIDVDVASFYPNIPIANRLYPQHLGERFCDIYLDVYLQRRGYAKKTPENAMLKLALNGVYGDSNNIYSPFYDPFYTMSVTINGQLLICKLAELMMNIPNLELIQVNTDGLTVRIPRENEPLVADACGRWERYACMTLERAEYEMMAIRDVNNYLAVYPGGDVKRKGAYEWRDSSFKPDNCKDWHQDQSALIAPYAAEQALVHGTPASVTVALHTDMFDFMLRHKSKGRDYTMLGDRKMPKTLRYYVTKNGEPLVKIAPPVAGKVEGDYKKKNGVTDAAYNAWHSAHGNTWNPDIHTGNKSTYEQRRTSVDSGWLCSECNHVRDFDWNRLNRDYYIKEAEKLIDPLVEADG